MPDTQTVYVQLFIRSCKSRRGGNAGHARCSGSERGAEANPRDGAVPDETDGRPRAHWPSDPIGKKDPAPESRPFGAGVQGQSKTIEACSLHATTRDADRSGHAIASQFAPAAAAGGEPDVETDHGRDSF